MSGINVLAYFPAVSVTKEKSFMTITPSNNFWQLFPLSVSGIGAVQLYTAAITSPEE